MAQKPLTVCRWYILLAKQGFDVNQHTSFKRANWIVTAGNPGSLKDFHQFTFSSRLRPPAGAGASRGWWGALLWAGFEHGDVPRFHSQLVPGRLSLTLPFTARSKRTREVGCAPCTSSIWAACEVSGLDGCWGHCRYPDGAELLLEGSACACPPRAIVLVPLLAMCPGATVPMQGNALVEARRAGGHCWASPQAWRCH